MIEHVQYDHLNMPTSIKELMADTQTVLTSENLTCGQAPDYRLEVKDGVKMFKLAFSY